MPGIQLSKYAREGRMQVAVAHSCTVYNVLRATCGSLLKCIGSTTSADKVAHLLTAILAEHVKEEQRWHHVRASHTRL